MKGIILAGGQGSRLKPLTNILNKHLLPVYNKPMIDYPIQSLIDLGCDDILIISGGNNIGNYADYLGDGSRYGVTITYRVQKEAGGIADALKCCKTYMSDIGLFPVILGDNYFETPIKLNKPGIIISKVKNPERFGVYDKKTNQIIEKPKKHISNYAVTGLYWFDYKVFSIANRLMPSERNELEITDVNNHILLEGGQVAINKDYWSDMGTFDSLNDTANFIRRKINNGLTK